MTVDPSQHEEKARRALTCPVEEALPLLGELGFAEPERALKALDRLAGEPPGVAPLPDNVLVELVEAGRPDRGLRHLERFVEVTGGRLSLYARLAEDPLLARRLALVLSHSQFLTDILVRNPEYLYWLFEESPYLEEPMDRRTLRQILRRDMGRGDRGERLEALRRVQRREMLRIGAAEILGLKDAERTGRELADLADAIVEIVLDLCTRELVGRYGRPQDGRGNPAHFLVVCLGKHGGQELNFSSDIDLMFLYDGEGETGGGRGGQIDNGEFFTRLGERLVQELTATTAQGFFYRVDMRLRPEGKSGPLVRSLRGCWIYYETRGELWERQMLIKARRAAGSAGLWRQFAEMLEPFIYPAHFTRRPQEEIRRIKERIEARIQERRHGDNHIKLQAGGIRDIEFIVQCLQLLRGRVDGKSRAHNSLEAIARLRRSGALSQGEAESLRAAYLFFRRLENLLQIDEGRSVYALPEDGEERRALSRLLGVEGELDAVLGGHLREVRRIYEGLFYGEQEPEERWDWLLEAPEGSERAARALEELGFAHGEAAHRHLQRLAGLGLMLSGSRERLDALLPELLASLASAPDADGGLRRFAQVVEVYGAPSTFYELLQAHPGFRRLLIAICGSSRFLAEMILRDPSLLDALVSPADIAAAEAVALRGEMADVRRFRNQEMLRIGTEDLLGLASQEETFLRLAELAEKVLGMVYRRAWRTLVGRYGRPRDHRGGEAFFACFAGGKFGGRELDFGSDLDLFFAYSGEGETGRGTRTSREFFIELAREIIRLLHDEGLFRVDARLRPEGASAPMAISLTAYGKYLKGRAAPWERLALSRARPVAGDEALGRKVMRKVSAFVYGSEVDAPLVEEMRQMRRRMEPRQERGRPPVVDIKRGPGGVVDAEFAAQMGLLKWGRKDRGLRSTSTRRVLEGLCARGYLDEEQGGFLLEAYERLREVEKGMRIASDKAVDTLPSGEELKVLARMLGQPEPDLLLEEINTLMQRTREVFEQVFAGLAK